MSISGQDLEKLRDALIDAFPNKASIEQMLLFKLDKNLDAIAGGSNVQEVIFYLIKESKAENWTKDLIVAARESNPGNSSLEAIAEEILQQYYPEEQNQDLRTDNVNTVIATIGFIIEFINRFSIGVG